MVSVPMGSLPTTLTHEFSRVPQADIQRSTFNRMSGLKTTFDAGYLIPIFVDEVVPGDTFNLTAYGTGRVASLVYPLMDNIYIETFFFYIPDRLVWDNFEKFMGAQDDPGDSIDYLVPQITNATVAEGDNFDYMGLPTKVSGLNFNNLHGRAFNLVYNTWFRDENLIDSLVVDKDDGPDTYSDYAPLRKRGKRYDYYTSSLTSPQKGDAVSIPLGTTAPVASTASADNQFLTALAPTIGTGDYILRTNEGYLKSANITTTADQGELYADLSDATAATINQLREAFQIQRLLERDSRGGTRYTEILQSHFSVTSPDLRLQRPEYLGGSKTSLQIQAVAQTSSTDSTTPQGNLSAVGTANARGGFSKSFVEHGVIIGLCSAHCDLTYQQGVNRMWSRRDRYDFYFPVLAHLGEQSVLNKEIYFQGTSADDNVFGYQERWAEMRYKPSMVTGKMRSNATGTLDAWHLAQDFGSLPALNQSFIEENPPMDRVVAVPTEPDFVFDWYFDLKCTRPMPTYSVPGLIDHF